ncbi:MAG: CarD family transcriptional regulator [Verrucomicrobiae bacterium]|nr:CarD family transcriptional regulator [Verrucomicrobiae bacterium]
MAQKKKSNLGSKATKTVSAKVRGDAKISDAVKSKSAKTVPAKAATSKPGSRVASKAASAKPSVKSGAKSPVKAAHSKAEVAKPLGANSKLGPSHANKSQPGKTAAAKSSAAKAPPASKNALKTAAKASVAPAKPAAKPMPTAKATAPAAAKPMPAASQQRPVIAAEKAQGPKITGPAPAVAAPAAAKAAPKPAPVAEKKFDKLLFKINEYVVYPTQGVGKVIAIEEEEIAGMKLELFKIEFEKERLVLRVPMGKVPSVGMRKIADDATVKRALETLKGRARIKRTMWSRRAQEYVAKINSGNLTAIAEVVRDLYRSEAQPEQSYSERQLYENALERMAREVAIVERLDERGAVQRITEILSKSAKGRAVASEVPAGDDDVKAA